jgi:pullulanase
LKEGNPDATEEELIRMDRLAQTAVLTSQGVPFLHGGAELLRTKQGVGNSYKSPDSINAIDWTRKTTHRAVYSYYKGLIALRKAHPSFRLPTTALIQQHLRFLDTGDPLLIAYTIKGVGSDSWKEVLVILNGSSTSKAFTLPNGSWTVAADGEQIVEGGLRLLQGEAKLGSTTGWVLFRK